MNFELVLFYFFSIAAIIFGLMVINSKNPIHSVFFLVLVFFSAAALLILIHAEFLAMAFLVIYVGAIAILFLFVVMMLNIQIIQVREYLYKFVPIGGLVGLVFIAEMYLILRKDLTPLVNHDPINYINWSDQVVTYSNIEALGNIIYTHYFYLFLTCGMILLVAMIGAIVLTIQHKSDVRRQDVFSQVTRDFRETVELRS